MANAGWPPYHLAFCPRLAAGRQLNSESLLEKIFSKSELALFAAVPAARKLDRLAGRMAAKRAIAALLTKEYDWSPAPTDIEIENDGEGRPVLRLPQGAPFPMPEFSISHCAEGGAAAAAPAGRKVGIDIETVVARPQEVIAFVAAAREMRGANSDPEAQARIWTGKEAALKLLGLGLDADAKNVIVTDSVVELTGVPGKTWEALGRPGIRVHYERCGGAMIAVAHTL